jgi:hypothetical protein
MHFSHFHFEGGSTVRLIATTSGHFPDVLVMAASSKRIFTLSSQICMRRDSNDIDSAGLDGNFKLFN